MVITIDNRGHGASAKPTDPAAYDALTMAEDRGRCSIIWRSRRPM